MKVGDRVKLKDNAYYRIDPKNGPNYKFKPGTLGTVIKHPHCNRTDAGLVLLDGDSDGFGYYMYQFEVEII